MLERIEQDCDPAAGRTPKPHLPLAQKRLPARLLLAHSGVGDLPSKVPLNWGAVLLGLTGSKFHNQQLCQHAITRGLKFASLRGVMRGEEILASETEEAIYEALGAPFIEPIEREGFGWWSPLTGFSRPA